MYKGMAALEVWSRRAVEGYPGVSIVNMSSSWRDGKAFCALIHRYRPTLIDWEIVENNDVKRNCALAFSIAEKELDIPQLLDPQDMAECVSPDRYSILTYVSEFYHKFKDCSPQPAPRQPARENNLRRKDSTDSGIVPGLSRNTSSVSSCTSSSSMSTSSSSSVCDSPPPTNNSPPPTTLPPESPPYVTRLRSYKGHELNKDSATYKDTPDTQTNDTKDILSSKQPRVLQSEIAVLKRAKAEKERGLVRKVSNADTNRMAWLEQLTTNEDMAPVNESKKICESNKILKPSESCESSKNCGTSKPCESNKTSVTPKTCVTPNKSSGSPALSKTGESCTDPITSGTGKSCVTPKEEHNTPVIRRNKETASRRRTKSMWVDSKSLLVDFPDDESPFKAALRKFNSLSSENTPITDKKNSEIKSPNEHKVVEAIPPPKPSRTMRVCSLERDSSANNNNNNQMYVSSNTDAKLDNLDAKMDNLNLVDNSSKKVDEVKHVNKCKSVKEKTINSTKVDSNTQTEESHLSLSTPIPRRNSTGQRPTSLANIISLRHSPVHRCPDYNSPMANTYHPVDNTINAVSQYQPNTYRRPEPQSGVYNCNPSHALHNSTSSLTRAQVHSPNHQLRRTHSGTIPTTAYRGMTIPYHPTGQYSSPYGNNNYREGFQPTYPQVDPTQHVVPSPYLTHSVSTPPQSNLTPNQRSAPMTPYPQQSPYIYQSFAPTIKRPLIATPHKERHSKSLYGQSLHVHGQSSLV